MPPKMPWVHGVCLLLALTCTHALAAPSRLIEHRVLIPERGEVLGYIIAADTNHYSFLPPPGWRVSCKPGVSAVVMISTNLTTSITIDFLDADRGANMQELLSSRYPDGRVRKTFASFTGLGDGMAFDIERKIADASTLASRVVYATQQGGIVEFTLTTPNSRFAEWTTTFANVVNSFHRPAR